VLRLVIVAAISGSPLPNRRVVPSGKLSVSVPSLIDRFRKPLTSRVQKFNRPRVDVAEAAGSTLVAVSRSMSLLSFKDGLPFLNGLISRR
jgi:hypothetical protein